MSLNTEGYMRFWPLRLSCPRSRWLPPYLFYGNIILSHPAVGFETDSNWRIGLNLKLSRPSLRTSFESFRAWISSNERQGLAVAVLSPPVAGTSWECTCPRAFVCNCTLTISVSLHASGLRTSCEVQQVLVQALGTLKGRSGTRMRPGLRYHYHYCYYYYY